MKHNFELYCIDPENIENYEKAKKNNFKGWEVHHRLETHNSDGERRLVDITRDELIALGMYWNRPASELIFLKRCKHRSLHMKGNTRRLDKCHSEESKKKIGEANKGKHRSEQTRKKMGEAKKGNKYALGYKHSEKIKKKIGEAKKGALWYNNGKINIRAKECPPGFLPGMLKRK